MGNDQMIAGRFARWAAARARLRAIQQHLQAGGSVMIPTYTKCTVYRPKHAAMFGVSRTNGLYVMRGKSKDHLLFTSIRFV